VTTWRRHSPPGPNLSADPADHQPPHHDPPSKADYRQVHPARSAAHKDYEEQIKNAPDGARRTTWRAAGGEDHAGPVDLRASLAGVQDRLARRNGDRDHHDR